MRNEQRSNRNARAQFAAPALFGAARLILRAYIQCKAIHNPEIDKCLTDVAESKSTTEAERTHTALRKVADILRTHVYTEGNGSVVDEVVLEFVEFASRPAVGLEAYFRDRAS